MGDLDGKTIFITGANTGIGRATAEALGARGARLWLAGRSEERTKPVVDAIRAGGNLEVRFLALDLGELASVRRAAETFLESGEPLDVLLNNAGLAGARGLTKDGFELTFGVNHLGHFLLTQLFTERLVSTERSRVVNVSSRNHYKADGIDWDALRAETKSRTGLPEYAVSKLCNVLHAKELGRRLGDRGVTTYSLHPGRIASDVWRSVPWPIRPLMTLFMKSNSEGAATSIHCAVSAAAADESGLYYDSCRPVEPSRLALDALLAAELWERSEAWAAA